MPHINASNRRTSPAQIAAAAVLLLLTVLADATGSAAKRTTQRTNLAVDATVTGKSLKDGFVVTFTVRITNEGPENAEGVLLETIADAGILTILSERRIQATNDARCHVAILACEIGDLAADDVVTIRIVTKVTTSETVTVGLEFRIASQTIDSVPFDNRYYSSAFVPGR